MRLVSLPIGVAPQGALLVALLVLVCSSCAALHVPLPPEAELYRAKTDDGWELGLVRYKAVGKTTGLPVLLCHGISANARNLDLDEAHSLARWFAAHGREAWTMSMRAAGDSDRPDEAKGRHPPIFDDYWRHDLPAAIRQVQQVSGAPLIDYVGHSMGGMIIYAYLSQQGQGLNAVATLGSPTRLDWGSGTESLLKVAPALLSKTSMLPSRLGSWLTAPFQGAVDDGLFERLFYNHESTSTLSFQRLMAYGTSDTAGGVALQLLRLVETGKFASNDGSLDFRAGLHRVTLPVLVVAARLDRIALTPAVRDGYEALGGRKEWLLISRANGARAEYGHMDLVIGERAPDEVWSHVLDFLNRHAP
jgi:pimeloyl-ACP methyl ester carboxylesterase